MLSDSHQQNLFRNASTRQARRQQITLSPEEQIEVNRVTGEIAKRIRKLSMKICQLQQQVRILNAMNGANMKAPAGSAEGVTSGLDELGTRISTVLVMSPATPKSRDSSFAAEKSKERRSSRLRKIMMVRAIHSHPLREGDMKSHIQNLKEQPTTTVSSQLANSLPATGEADMNIRDNTSLNDSTIEAKLHRALMCTPRKPASVSVGTQSPDIGAVMIRQPVATSTPIASGTRVAVKAPLLTAGFGSIPAPAAVQVMGEVKKGTKTPEMTSAVVATSLIPRAEGVKP